MANTAFDNTQPIQMAPGGRMAMALIDWAARSVRVLRPALLVPLSLAASTPDGIPPGRARPEPPAR